MASTARARGRMTGRSRDVSRRRGTPTWKKSSRTWTSFVRLPSSGNGDSDLSEGASRGCEGAAAHARPQASVVDFGVRSVRDVAASLFEAIDEAAAEHPARRHRRARAEDVDREED